MKLRSTIIVVLLVMGTNLVLTGTEEARAAVLTVSDDGTGMYTSIQAAIDNAFQGDIIYIANGTYREDLFIDRSNITLRGSDPNLTRIIASSISVGLQVNGDDVEISGMNITGGRNGIEANLVKRFTVVNSSLQGSSYSIVSAQVENLTIKNCTLINESVILESKDSYLYSNHLINGGLSIFGTTSAYWTSHSIGTSNKVNGKDLVYLKGATGGSITEASGQIIIAGCQSVSISAQSISNVKVPVQIGFSNMITLSLSAITDCRNGIYLYRSTSSTIAHCNVRNSTESGIFLDRSDWNWIADSNISSNKIGINIIDSNNNTMTDDITSNNTGQGIRIFTEENTSSSKDNLIRECISSGNRLGIEINHSSENSILESIISGNHESGILIESSPPISVALNNNVEDTRMTDNMGTGLLAMSDGGTSIDECFFSGNMRGGIMMYYSESSKITNSNMIDQPQRGLSVISGSSFVHNNYFRNCSKTGVHAVSGNEIEVYSNHFRGENSGCDMDGEKIAIFGNHFNATSIDLTGNRITFHDNVVIATDVDSEGSIEWNISRTPGTNIIGGPYLGGNYWSDYKGLDTDGDGIGDTSVPHGPGDLLPLQYDIIAPTISDVSKGSPTTGDIYEIRAIPEDERVEIFPYVEYWFGEEGEHTNESMMVCDPWGLDIVIPYSSTEPLNYICSVVDGSGNWNFTEIITREVLDNDDPLVEGFFGNTSASTEDEITLTYVVTDNIEIADVRMTILNVTGNQYDISFHSTDGLNYTFIIPPQKVAGTITYSLNATDTSGNSFRSGTGNISIVDEIRPEIHVVDFGDDPTSGYVDIEVMVTDAQSQVSWLSISIISTESGVETELYNISSLSGFISRQWDSTMYSDGDYLVIFRALDSFLNLASVSINLTIDNTAPVPFFTLPETIHIGDHVQLNASLSSDNMEGKPLFFKWEISGESGDTTLSGMIRTHEFESGGQYRISLEVSDLAGNHDTMSVNITVLTGAEPPIINDISIEDGSVDVPVNITITISFSEAMNRTSVGASITLKPSVIYRLFWADDDQEVRMEFPDGLEHGTVYNLTLEGPQSLESLHLVPYIHSIRFSTEGMEIPKIDITFPTVGQVFRPMEIITISGRISGGSAGDEIVITLGGKTFGGVAGSGSKFIVDVIAPETVGFHDLGVTSGSGSSTVTIEVQQEDNENNNIWLPLLGILLILLILIVGAYIWISKSPTIRMEEEFEE